MDKQTFALLNSAFDELIGEYFKLIGESFKLDLDSPEHWQIRGTATGIIKAITTISKQLGIDPIDRWIQTTNSEN